MSITTSRILLVRHGRTALNAEGRLRGLADPELDPTGIGQALDTAFALRSEHIGLVFSSPLSRAVSTATIIARISGVDHRAEPAFNDRDYGEWTGQIKTEVINEWGSVDVAPGVEAEEAVRDRAFSGLAAIAASQDAATVAVVTHDAVIRPILTAISPGIDLTVATGSWSEIVPRGERWSIASVDNTP